MNAAQAHSIGRATEQLLQIPGTSPCSTPISVEGWADGYAVIFYGVERTPADSQEDRA